MCYTYVFLKHVVTIMNVVPYGDDCFLSLYMQAFFEGKLKIAGNTSLAMKLQSIMPKPPKSKL